VCCGCNPIILDGHLKTNLKAKNKYSSSLDCSHSTPATLTKVTRVLASNERKHAISAELGACRVTVSDPQRRVQGDCERSTEARAW